MSGRTDPFATFDAAYVLGALSPEDRAAFEEHLRHCAGCARGVRELAGMPGLLGQVDAGHRPSREPLPADLLPSLLWSVRKRRRRGRTVGAVAVAAAGIAAALALVFALVLPASTEREGTAMTPLGAYPVAADVSLTDSGSGTQVDMSCSYSGGSGGDYVLVAVRADGGTQRLATWYAAPKDTAKLSIGTTLDRADIKALEIRLPDGPALLRLPVSG
ncbi:anti-sigma factor [Prauserella marina]|uniref:anti-sigma factor family protein n=1 Tax=Prauserella marina TaxID=530584 RepID=UPI000B8D32CC|nr:zf-HC2 domain-containing protein [Prauserella marina]ASR39493.1 anti-sigma factor [Prauserella marina]